MKSRRKRRNQRKLRTIIVGAATLFLGTAVSAFAWQGPGHVKVKVQFTHKVHVNNDVLPPGKYTIESMCGKESSNNILKIYTDHGQTFETSASTIDVLNRDTADKTKVVLERLGNDYYLDKMWIAGRNYGYQVILPETVRNRINDMHPEEIEGTSEGS
jgi:hypothetical protein